MFVLEDGTVLRIAFPYIEVGLLVKAASEEVWQILVDTSRWVEWGPSIRNVESNERFLTALSSGLVRTVPGFSVPFAVTRFEPGKTWSWRVFGIPATTHTVESLGANRSRLLFGVPLIAFPYLLVCLVAIKRISLLIERSHDPASAS
jgi:hypothetical protein